LQSSLQRKWGAYVTKCRSRNEQQELADQARLANAWRTWHSEQLADAIAGPHGIIVTEVMDQLDGIDLNSGAATLLACIQRLDWSTVSYDVRLTVLHQINAAITRLRTRQGLAPIDDPLPGQSDNAFRRIKSTLFPQ
jgi:hypothetical protein